MSAFPKSVCPGRIRENFDVFEFELTAGELGAIAALDTGIRRGHEPAGITLETSGRDMPEPEERAGRDRMDSHCAAGQARRDCHRHD